MNDSQVIIYRRKRESYRTGQTNPYKLVESVKRRLIAERELFRFMEDYFHISRDAVYRYVKSNDPALTQIGFLQELAARLDPKMRYESLIEKS